MKYLLTIILILCASLAVAKPTDEPVYSDFRILDSLESEKPIRIQWITQKAQPTPPSVLTLSIDVAGGLIYDGPMSWQIDLAINPVCTTEFTVIIPRSDTCVIAIRGNVSKPSSEGQSYISRSITFLRTDQGKLQSILADFRTWSDDQKELMKYHGYRYGDSALGIPAQEVPPPGYDKPRPMPPDSMGTSSSEYVSPLDQEITLKRMKERKSCVVDTEFVRVADTLFVRLRGEKLFKKIKSDTSK